MTETFDLRTNVGLEAASSHVAAQSTESREVWTRRLREFLDWVGSADEATRASLAFQQRLWDDNPVAGVGMGTIAVDSVIENEEFRNWLARNSFAQLPVERKGRTEVLLAIYEEMVGRFKKSLPRIPHLKIFRVLAAFFPRDFTTIAHRGALERTVRRMRGTAGENPVALHAYVRDRLDDVLGQVGDDPEEQVRRLELPWYLYELTEGKSPGEEKVTKPGSVPGVELLEPLPAARRRRGLTALAGGFPAALGILQEVKDGLTREEFLDYLRSLHPTLKESSRRMIANVLRSELGLIKHVDDQYALTERGAAVLESSTADEMGDWLLTRVLGVDHVLKALEKEPANKSDLVSLLKRVNPGWTSDFAPTAMLNWLVSMKVLERMPDGRLALDELGQEWMDRVDWTPEFLQVDADPEGEVPPPPSEVTGEVSLPPLKSIIDRVTTKDHAFDARLVEQLHLGLWSPKRRHFAILTGISGSGKTLLAKKYAEALGTTDGDGPRRLCIQDVQPGWYDSSPLLGHLNPLQRDTYQRTSFLNFLLRASKDPQQPYLVILDEMNLSHPEQYFAPLISSMESGNEIRLHAEGGEFDGIPESVPYPSNLAIIGTVNMDETTHGLSDKVLDRAFTLEFWDIKLDAYPRWKKTSLSTDQELRVKQVLEGLMDALKPPRLHFGWRIVDDVVDFLGKAGTHGIESDFNRMLDAVIYAKVLPKLRGEDSPRLQAALGQTRVVLDEFGLKSSAERVEEMRSELSRTGSVRFWR